MRTSTYGLCAIIVFALTLFSGTTFASTSSGIHSPPHLSIVSTIASNTNVSSVPASFVAYPTPAAVASAPNQRTVSTVAYCVNHGVRYSVGVQRPARSTLSCVAYCAVYTHTIGTVGSCLNSALNNNTYTIRTARGGGTGT